MACEAMRDLMKDEIHEEVMKHIRRFALNLSNQGIATDIIATAIEVDKGTVEEWLKESRPATD